VQESARDQNKFGRRVEQPYLSDVTKQSFLILFKIGKKIKQKQKNADNQCWLRLLMRFHYMSFVEVSKFVIWRILMFSK